MRDSLAAAAFYGVNALLAPVSVAGYLLWVGKLMTNRGQGVSGTAQAPLSTRCFEHMLGTRKDEAAARLMVALPNVSPLAVRMVTGPLRLGHRLTGYVPRAFRYPFEGEVPPQCEVAARTGFFDSMVQRHLTSIHQLVILGAGFDTRALDVPGDARAFEVDAPKTQAVKRGVLEKTGIDASRVTFVSADFEHDDWLARLGSGGFDLTKPALFLWEGVTMYLDRAGIEATLRKIAGTAQGSVVAFDYFTTEVLTSRSLYWRYARFATNAAHEPLRFGVDSTPPTKDRLSELLESCGLVLGEQTTLGDEMGGKRAWGGFATAVVRP